MTMITRSARVVAMLVLSLLVACGSDGSTGPVSNGVSPTTNVCASLAANPAVVLTQGVITSSTVYRIESRWCRNSAPTVQILEFNPSSFTGDLNVGIAFAQNYARLSANGVAVVVPAGVTLIGGPQGL
jgi:hypothetical protein